MADVNKVIDFFKNRRGNVVKIGGCKIKNGELIKYRGDDSNVRIPSVVTVIGKKAFESRKIVSVTVPSGVTSIKEQAFLYCFDLEEAEISETVSEIASDAFELCTSLGWYTVSEGNRYFKSKDGDIYSYSGDTLVAYAIGKRERHVSIDGITHIGANVFAWNKYIETADIGSSVRSIGNCAFSCCQSLTRVIIPDWVTEVGESAFQGCSALSEIVIGSGVKTLEFYCFGDCVALTHIVIPENINIIESFAFSGCVSLEEVEFSDSLQKIGFNAFNLCRSLRRVVIPESVREISSEAFSKCSSLEDVAILSSEITIYTNAFVGCGSIRAVICRPETETALPKNLATKTISKFIAHLKDGTVTDAEKEIWHDVIKNNTLACFKTLGDDIAFCGYVIENIGMSESVLDEVISVTSSIECRVMLLEYKRSFRTSAE